MIYLLYRVALHWSSFSGYHMAGYAVLLILSGTMKNMVVASRGAGSSGEYFEDVLYITLFVQLGSMYSDHFWWTYLVIPLYAIYSFIKRIVDWVFAPDAADEEPDPNDPMTQKRARRAAHREKKYA